MQTTDEIREMFLDFFYKKNHKIIPGSSLIPINDNSLLFTNAGMNQFKNIFLETTNRTKYKKVATSQFCLRMGGKHNDFKNVGYTTKHHTFFEMLGNFSFGDYFKLESILYSWEFLTSKKWLNLPLNKLWITVYNSDIETYEIWKNKIKISEKRIIKINDQTSKYTSDNFWTMGENGPCGPSTEIFYDHGKKFPGNPPNNKNLTQGIRFVEIWNIVFIQFNKVNNKIIKLSKSFVDTGMGLERISAIMQKKISNYEIDIFHPLVKYIKKCSTLDLSINQDKSLYVIADHIRACAFIISENVTPSNEKQGYILRKIIRRIIIHGYNIGINSLFLHKLIPVLINSIGKIGLILEPKKEYIQNILKSEEKKFILTLKKGLHLLDKEISQSNNYSLNNKTIFKLYDTFGFPLDLTRDICRERNIHINEIELQKYLQEQKQKNCKNFTINTQITPPLVLTKTKQTIFSGYKIHKIKSNINNIIVKNIETSIITENQTGIIFLKKTPFFSESSGQIGDSGKILNQNGEFLVNNTKTFNNYIGHIGKMISGSLKLSDEIIAKIDFPKRKHIQINHSTTHLLHSALKQKLGQHISQKGSFISEKILKFDFSHTHPINLHEIHQIENIVNKEIHKNSFIQEHFMSLKQAKEKKTIALFQEKYDDIVRVIQINDFSIEACTGTHTKYTGDIGFFKIISNFSVSSGVRRIEAVTGNQAILKIHNQELEIQELSNMLNAKKNNLKNQIKNLLSKIKDLEKSAKLLNNYQIKDIANKCSNEFILIKDVKIIFKTLEERNVIFLRNIADILKNKLKSAIIIISSISNNQAKIIVTITKNLLNKISATELLSVLIKNLNGKGGGKKNIAEGGIKNIDDLPKEFKKIIQWIKAKL